MHILLIAVYCHYCDSTWELGGSGTFHSYCMCICVVIIFIMVQNPEARSIQLICNMITYRQPNKIMAYLTFHKWLVSVCNIHNDITNGTNHNQSLGKSELRYYFIRLTICNTSMVNWCRYWIYLTIDFRTQPAFSIRFKAVHFPCLFNRKVFGIIINVVSLATYQLDYAFESSTTIKVITYAINSVAFIVLIKEHVWSSHQHNHFACRFPSYVDTSAVRLVLFSFVVQFILEYLFSSKIVALKNVGYIWHLTFFFSFLVTFWHFKLFSARLPGKYVHFCKYFAIISPNNVFRSLINMIKLILQCYAWNG